MAFLLRAEVSRLIAVYGMVVALCLYLLPASQRAITGLLLADCPLTG